MNKNKFEKPLFISIIIICALIFFTLFTAIYVGVLEKGRPQETYTQISKEETMPAWSLVIEESTSFPERRLDFLGIDLEEPIEEAESELILEEITVEEVEVYEPALDPGFVYTPVEEYYWDGPILTATKGVNYGPSGKETYYNLPMDGVIEIMRVYCNNYDEHWIREDGCHMLGDYIMVAADLSIRPRGSLVPTSLGMGIVCDTGGFIYIDAYQLDIAVVW